MDRRGMDALCFFGASVIHWPNIEELLQFGATQSQIIKLKAADIFDVNELNVAFASNGWSTYLPDPDEAIVVLQALDELLDKMLGDIG